MNAAQNEPSKTRITHTLAIKWGTSRGRDTYGYTTCTLSEDGKRLAAFNGGGYDMRGTVFGDWLARAYRNLLFNLKPEDMPENSHWEPDHLAFICYECSQQRDESVEARVQSLSEESPTCPHCGVMMRHERGAGKRVDDGRYFYGLTFHDPDYDPGKAVIGKDCSDRTLGDGAVGKTVEQAETAGVSFGLERYQAIYSSSSKVPTARHTFVSVDGGCGFDSVRKIAEAIGLSVRLINASRKLDLIEITEAKS